VSNMSQIFMQRVFSMQLLVHSSQMSDMNCVVLLGVVQGFLFSTDVMRNMLGRSKNL
jgi:hypothetical protein